MTVKHQFLPQVNFRNSSRHAWLLALGLALLPSLTGFAWAENFNLESVDFSNNDAGLRIVLHTGSIVPVQKVLISDSKLVLDIDQVNAGETVRTNFSGAGNVSHVIVQPLNEHKVRMIIRGEGLSAPSIAFYGSGATDNGSLNAEESARLAAETSLALHRQQESGLQPAVNKQSTSQLGASESAAVDHPSYREDAPIGFGGFVDDKTTAQNHARGIKPSETGPLALRHSMNPSSNEANEVMGQLGRWGNYIPYGLLALVLLGAGVFVRHRLTQLAPSGMEYETVNEEFKPSKRTSFRELADAYRNKHDEKRLEQPLSRKTAVDDMIGLRGLDQVLEKEEKIQPVRQQSVPLIDEPIAPNALEQILAAMQAANKPKKPMGVPAPKKQAVNQYQQAQSAKPKSGKNRQTSDELMLQEMKRAQTAQQELQQQIRQSAAQSNAVANNSGPAPVNRAAAAKKAIKTPNFQTIPSGKPVSGKMADRLEQIAKPAIPGKSSQQLSQQSKAAQVPKKNGSSPSHAPLSGNPEVLNFLRNVADLMEKDGKGEIAKSIHKNLSSKNLNGLTK